ncbi:MAG TPA: hypothetical protein VNW71_11485 [Thermoanaerobaculia bacterium]|nr:hypothetical protein [Thermoanaerobaculia bacterium]
MRQLLVLSLFFLSGAAALIYEVSWSRLVGLQVGHTVHAAAVTLAAYFVGMAVGSHWSARWLPRVKRPFLVYAAAELVVAAWALSTPALVALVDGLGIHSLGGRAALSMAVLLPATVALGTTLPSVAQHLSASGGERIVALAYGVNTAGAVAGALLATYLLIGRLGVRGSGFSAAALSALCGFAALGLALRPPAPRDPQSGKRPIAPVWYLTAAATGFSTLALEVLYTRLWGLTLQNSTYTFGAVLAVFLVALAAGGVLVSRFGSRFDSRTGARSWTGWAALLAALGVLGSVLAFAQATRFEYFRPGGGFAAYVVQAVLLVAAVVGPPVACLATVLPASWSAAGGSERSAVGRLTAVNTLSGAAGAIVTSFVLLPLLDLWYSFALVAALLVALAAVHFRPVWTPRRRLALAASALAVLGFALTFPRRPHGMNGAGRTLVTRASSAYGWTDVVARPGGHLSLHQNIHDELGSSAYAWYLEREGHVPMLLHPCPRRVLFLGMGTGITAGAATKHREVGAIEVVELVGDVAEAARRFAPYNHGLADHPRARVFIDDARHFLRSRGGRYDVIVSDLFVPWHSQNGSLYTVEHYGTVLRSLDRGGIFCQWLLTSELGARELDLIADSFASVFPFTTVWRGDAGRMPLLALVGSREPIAIDTPQLARRLSRVEIPPSSESARSFDSTAQLLDLYLGRWRVRNPGWLNTDDHPRVELLAPVTEGNFTLLLGRRLLDYRERVLKSLPREGLELTGEGDAGCAERPERSRR